MLEPVTTSALISAGIGAGVSAVQKLWSHYSSRDIRKLQSRTLNQMEMFNNDLLRRARGKFTDAEIAQIKRNAEPYVNAVAGNVAARGLGGSAAGASVVAEAQQRPFFAAQSAATQAVPGSLQNLMNIVNQNLGMFQGDEGIAKEFAGLIQSYSLLKGLNTPTETTTPPGQGYVNRDLGGELIPGESWSQGFDVNSPTPMYDWLK